MDGAAVATDAFISSADLRRALAPCLRAIERRTTIPVLATVRVAIASGTCTLTATDLDTEVQVVTGANGDLPPVTIAPGYLSALARWPVGVTLAVEGDVLSAATFGSILRLRELIPATDFPDFAFAPGPSLTVPEGVLDTALDRVLPCVAEPGSARYYPEGVFVDTADGDARLVATDGRRLCAYAVPELQAAPPGILPAKALRILRAALRPGGNQPVRLTWQTGDAAATRIEAHVGDMRLRAKLIDGTFPDWRRYLQPRGEAPATVAHVEPEAVARVAAMIFGDRQPCLRIDPQAGTISYLGPNGAEVTVESGGDRGAPFGLNLHYLRSAMRGRPVRLEGHRAGDAVHVVTDDPAETMIIMPMRLP